MLSQMRLNDSTVQLFLSYLFFPTIPDELTNILPQILILSFDNLISQFLPSAAYLKPRS